MPTYRYRCAKCGDEIEQYQSFSDAPLTRHQVCGGKLAKVLSTPGIVLKGSGFYRTDNRNGSSKRSSTKSDDGATSDDAKLSDAKAGEKHATSGGKADSGGSGEKQGEKTDSKSPAKTGDTAS